MLASLDVGVLVQGPDTHLLYANAAAERLLGLSNDELLRRDSFDARWDVLRPDGSRFEQASLPVFEALRSGQPVRGVVLGVRRDGGSVAWLSVDALPQRGPDDRIAHVVITLTDITRQVAERLDLQTQAAALDDELGRVRREAADSEATSRGVLRAMAEGVALHGGTGEILFANPAAQEILGLSLDRQPLPPAAIPSEVTRRTGRAQRNVVLGVHRATGERAWLSVNTDPIDDMDPAGFCRVVATFTDITVEREALAAEASGRERLLRLTEALPGAVLEVAVDAQGTMRVPFASAALESEFGVAPAAVLADAGALWSAFLPEDQPRIVAAWRDAARTREAVLLEARLRRRDGAIRHVRLRSGPPTLSEVGVLFRALAVDVTERLALEQTLREALRRDAMGLLAAGIAHNFNNMLAAIVPNLEALRERVDAPLRPDVEDAYQAASAAGELVRQLMLLTRREAPSAPEPVDLGELAEEVARLCRRTFDRRIAVQCTVPSTPTPVLGRRAELQQVVLNLCLNARDALAETEGPVLALVVAAGPDGVTLEVADNGCGMSEAVQARLGEPFFTTKPPGRGTGLGVATVKGIVQDVGGQLSWESAPARGSRFFVRFAAHTPSAATVADAPAARPAPASQGRLLLVDDEDLVRRALARILARMGWDVVAVSSGDEALARLRDGLVVRVAMIDRSMPGMSGEELLSHLRRDWPRLPVILCSGYDSGSVGTDDVTRTLGKPFTEGQVRKALEDLLGT
ncbi:MAG: PAS domain S-box protein [Gemmatimonadaceae bacterium]|nr:PAS domain S-box protein [Gemmatimonadaceae bacterium]